MLYNFYNLFLLESPIPESNANARYLKKKKSFILFLDAKILTFSCSYNFITNFPQRVKISMIKSYILSFL